MNSENLISRKNKMKGIVVIAILCLLSTACFGQEEYRNKKWHFSFPIPEGWDIVIDELAAEDYAQDMEIRFDYIEILTLLLKDSPMGRNSILVQAEIIGEAEKQYTVMENILKDQLSSNFYYEITQSYLENAKQKWIEQGIVAKEEKPKGLIYYDSEKNIYYEMTSLPRIKGGTIGKATARVLGFNRVTIFSFDLYGRSYEEILNFVKAVAESLEYDENYGFGEQPTKSIFKTLWFWLFPGFGTIIVAFLLYKWVASEYG